MKRISTRAKYMLVFLGFFVICLVFLVFSTFKDGATWAMHPSNQNLFTNGALKYESEISDRNGVLLLKTSEGSLIYNDNDAIRLSTLHTVGESTGNITTGLYTAKRYELAGYDRINGTFSFTGQGRDMTLTLDANLCAAAYNALGGRNGTIGVYNYKTGEILCMVSSPNYDPYNPPDFNGDLAEGLFLNRLLSGVYVPGSVFKLITTAAAIDTIPDIYDHVYHCDGGIEIDGEWISCLGNHGDIDIKAALGNSCNAAYAVIANEVGAETLSEYAIKTGFTSSFTMEGIKTVSGWFHPGSTNTELAWAGIGQHTDLANPYQMMLYAGAIANGGEPVTPYLIEQSGFLPRISLSKTGDRMLSEETAATLKSMMRSNVADYYGDGSFPGLNLCAKSGTAEVDGENPHAWFVGFMDSDTHPYAFVVVAENSGYGLQVAGSIANTVLQAAIGS